jgi:death-on-curing protein
VTTDEVYYLTVPDVYAIARDVAGDFVVREPGLLASAVARPGTVVFGVEAYSTLWEKAAALLHSLTSNHPLVDGNKRLGVASAVVFLARNGVDIDSLDEAAAYELMIDVASGALDEVPKIAERLAEAFGRI